MATQENIDPATANTYLIASTRRNPNKIIAIFVNRGEEGSKERTMFVVQYGGLYEIREVDYDEVCGLMKRK